MPARCSASARKRGRLLREPLPTAGRGSPTKFFIPSHQSLRLATEGRGWFWERLLRNLEPVRQPFDVPIRFDLSIKYVLPPLPIHKVVRFGIADGRTDPLPILQSFHGTNPCFWRQILSCSPHPFKKWFCKDDPRIIKHTPSLLRC